MTQHAHRNKHTRTHTPSPKDLANMVGWRSGHVVFDHGCLYKDPRTGLVAGFDPDREVYEGTEAASGVTRNAREPMACVVVTPAPLAVC